MQPAPKDIRCLDIWPLSRLTRIIIRTYRNLDCLGQIAIQYPVRVAAGKVAFEYLSAVPQDWARESIKEAAEQIRRGLERDRDTLEEQLSQQLDSGAPLEQIQATMDRYTRINEILEV
jgi:hypothetical protein